jgi:hypothetical protein
MATDSRMITECFTSFAGGRRRFIKIDRFALRLARRNQGRDQRRQPKPVRRTTLDVAITSITGA